MNEWCQKSREIVPNYNQTVSSQSWILSICDCEIPHISKLVN